MIIIHLHYIKELFDLDKSYFGNLVTYFMSNGKEYDNVELVPTDMLTFPIIACITTHYNSNGKDITDISLIVKEDFNV